MFWTIILNFITVLSFGLSSCPAIINIQGTSISLDSSATIVQLKAKRGALLVANDNFFIFTQEADEIQPIASISKLMTAMVFLKHNPDWNKIYKISSADNIVGGKINLFLGDEVSIKDLFYTSLVASDNGATMALVHASGLDEKQFIKEMNEQAQKLDLINTHFEDSTGLSVNNVSTAREVALLAQEAFRYPEIRQATTKSEYIFTTQGGRLKKIISTDYLLGQENKQNIKVLAGKTGYTDQAGYCFVGLLQKENKTPLIAVVLNSSDKNERFLEGEQLIDWAFRTYDLESITKNSNY
jgi:D-alanyl-D-alanine endopeptidase (penicillin-binding protein 7)